jgi:hypothetical protein
VWRILSWRISTGSGINIRRQRLMSDRHEIKERRGHRKRRETDEHDRDNGMPNEGHVASEG